MGIEKPQPTHQGQLGVVRSPASNRVWLPTALKITPYKEGGQKMGQYNHTFVRGYSEKKHNELESTGCLAPSFHSKSRHHQ